LKQKAFLTCSWRFLRSYALKKIGKNHWDLKTYRKINLLHKTNKKLFKNSENIGDDYFGIFFSCIKIEMSF
jgi:hypothetical protein